jgi:hypothetical protein
MKKHLFEAAERGDAEAQLNLGVIYENGLNDSVTLPKAIDRRPSGGCWPLPNRACRALKSNLRRYTPTSPTCGALILRRAGYNHDCFDIMKQTQ